jgi:carbon storage regulator
MLVLTRKAGEQIRIGEEITITVVRTKGKAVRLGIQAPAEVSILRGELAFEIETHAAQRRDEVEPSPRAPSTSDRNTNTDDSPDDEVPFEAGQLSEVASAQLTLLLS